MGMVTEGVATRRATGIQIGGRSYHHLGRVGESPRPRHVECRGERGRSKLFWYSIVGMPAVRKRLKRCRVKRSGSSQRIAARTFPTARNPNMAGSCFKMHVELLVAEVASSIVLKNKNRASLQMHLSLPPSLDRDPRSSSSRLSAGQSVCSRGSDPSFGGKPTL